VIGCVTVLQCGASVRAEVTVGRHLPLRFTLAVDDRNCFAVHYVAGLD
jgi:hypothetical protein